MVKITGLNSYVPEKVITNEMLAQKYPNDLPSAEYIEKVSGIKERRYSEKTSSGMATEAIKGLLDKTDTDPDSIDKVIITTVFPDTFFPSCAATVLGNLKIKNATAHDISAACSGFPFALEHASADLLAGGHLQDRFKKIIVCTADNVSRGLNAYDYKTGIIFGDASVAALVEKNNENTKGFKINNTYTKVIPDYLQDVYYTSPFGLKEGENWEEKKFELDGHKVYVHGVTITKQFIQEYCKKFNKNLDDYDYVIPHQANARMLNQLRKDLNLGDKLLSNIEGVGNTVSSSTPLCLDHFHNEGKFKQGDKILICSFGAGYTVGIIDIEVQLNK